MLKSAQNAYKNLHLAGRNQKNVSFTVINDKKKQVIITRRNGNQQMFELMNYQNSRKLLFFAGLVVATVYVGHVLIMDMTCPYFFLL